MLYLFNVNVNFEAMEDEIDDIVFDVILEHKTRHEAVKELLNLYPVMLYFILPKNFFTFLCSFIW
jgi:hypothetical protein